MPLHRFDTYSIKKKLMTLVILGWVLITVLITTFFVAQEIYTFKKTTVADLEGLAQVIAINCTAPLEFTDSDTAQEVLASLKARPHILKAGVYKNDGNLFALYKASPTLSALPAQFPYTYTTTDHVSFQGNRYLDVFVPITSDTNHLGTILIRSNVKAFSEKLRRTAYIVGLIFLITTVLAALVARMLRHHITEPILAMADTMRQIEQHKDYALRIANANNDELGMLGKGFNKMLETIERRDEQLNDAKQQAEHANLSKSKFLAQMSHEIRTPMNGVLGISALLKKTPLDEKQLHFVSTIQQSGENLLQVINDILDFSKIEAGKLELEHRLFTIHNMVTDVINIFSSVAVQKGIQLSSTLHRDVPSQIVGDQLRLRQILINLVGNAVKFTDNGQVQLNISVQDSADNTLILLFEIKDTGIGIASDKITTIFSAFSQADDSTTRKFGGTGLGLVISEELVKLHGGQIGVKSKLGSGSTFWFTASFEVAQQPGVNEQTAVIANNLWEAGQRFTDRSILVAEDNHTNQLVTRGILENLGCSVEVVENGLQAIVAQQASSYDLIFMDCQMPEMDGYAASKRIRQWEQEQQKARKPIIALTAHAMKGDREACIAAGMDDYVSKPCSEDQIMEVLLKWLKPV